MESTIVGVLGEQLPRDDDWEIDESGGNRCRWVPKTPENSEVASILLRYVDGWAVTIQRRNVVIEHGEEVLQHQLELVEYEAVDEAVSCIEYIMDG